MESILTEKMLKRHVGQSSFTRGLQYYRRNRVRAIQWAGAEIAASVQGSNSIPYKVTITLLRDGTIESSCTCPMEGYCKHVAAAGLAALPIINNTHDTKEQPSPAASEKPPHTTQQTNWRTQIEKLLSASSSRNSQSVAEQSANLELVFRIRPAERPYSAFSSFSSPAKPKAPWHLELRVRLCRAYGSRQSRTHLPWTTALHDYGLSYHHDLNALHALAMRELAFALGISYGSSSGWTAIPDERAALVWRALSHCADAGMEFRTGKKFNLPVLLSAEHLGATLTIQDGEKVLEVHPRFMLSGNDQTIENSRIVMIGDPPAFAILTETPLEHAENDIEMPLTLHALDSFFRSPAFKMFKKPITIPVKEISIFQKQYLPGLVRASSIHNKSNRIRIPEYGQPCLHISISRAGSQRIKVSLQFQYGDKTLPLDSSDAAVLQKNGAHLLRHSEAEQKLIREAETACGAYPEAWTEQEITEIPRMRPKFTLAGLEAARFVTQTTPVLRGLEGITVSMSEKVPAFTFDTSAPEISISVEQDNEQTGTDWFNLALTVTIGGDQVPFRLLFEALSKNEPFALLPSGRYFPTTHPRFAELHALIAEARRMRDVSETGFTISRFQIDFWRELKQMGIVERQAIEWQKVADTLLETGGVPAVAVPLGLNASLRPYQRDGFAWLAFLHEHRLGGVLGDDMGLGKTVQTIALIQRVREQNETSRKPFLVIAPTSVVENWDAELYRFTPHLNRVVLRRGDRSDLLSRISSADVVVTSYALLRRDFDILKPLVFDTLVLDEAQMVKNHQSMSYGLVRQLSAGRRFALSGTPMENNLMELWAIFSLVAPGLFGNPEQFRDHYQKPIERGGDPAAANRLRSRIRPFFLRRTKQIVEKDLPPKTEQTIVVELNPKHRRLYDLYLQRERQKVLGLLESGGLRAHRFQIFKSLTLMRRLALHPILAGPEHRNIPASKLDTLDEYLKTILAEDHRVLIFSQFTSFLSHVRSRLDARGISYCYLDGATKQRGELVRAFQMGSIPVFLISLKAGGFGLNLTAADYCILLDPWWNPAAERQAVDRTHRIGQTRPVNVYKFIAKGTIEEKVVALQEKKNRLFENIMNSGDRFSSQVTEQDIRELFA